MIHLLTAIGLTPGGSITVHMYTQTIHGTTQLVEWYNFRFQSGVPMEYPRIYINIRKYIKKN